MLFEFSTPDACKHDPIWRAYFWQMGWFNHQVATKHTFLFERATWTFFGVCFLISLSFGIEASSPMNKTLAVGGIGDEPTPVPSLALNACTAFEAMKLEMIRLLQAQSLLQQADSYSMQHTTKILRKSRFTGGVNATLGRGLQKLRMDHCCTRRHEYER